MNTNLRYLYEINTYLFFLTLCLVPSLCLIPRLPLFFFFFSFFFFFFNLCGSWGAREQVTGTESQKGIIVSPIPTFSFSLSLPLRQVTLNGHLLQLVDNTSLPELEPLEQKASDTVSLPALSFGFQVFKEANAQACM